MYVVTGEVRVLVLEHSPVADDLVDLLSLQPPFATVAEEVRVGIGGQPYAAERIDMSDDLFE